jgi:tetratricopeptide (TPR) repeat protein
VYNFLGYEYISLGKMQKAKEALENYIKYTPDAANPYDSMGEFYLIQKQYDQSIEMYEKALTKDPEFFMSQKGVGINHFYLGNHEKAREYWRKIVDFNYFNSFLAPLLRQEAKKHL